MYPAIQAAAAFPGVNPPDGIYPKMVTTWMPTIFLGIMLAVMVSALTASLSACLNSVSTLFTMDFYRKIDTKASSKKSWQRWDEPYWQAPKCLPTPVKH